MSGIRILSASEQVAEYLRAQISRRIHEGTMPGGERISRELGVGRMTVEAALAMLEDEGLLQPQGAGRRRRILSPKNITPPSLRVAILLYRAEDSKIYYTVDLKQQLINAGYFATFAPKTLEDLGMSVEKISRFVAKIPADAWIISSGSREVLEWFSRHHLPSFALAGGRRNVRIASTGPDKLPAIRTLVARLVELGHRRIVMLARKVRREPVPGRVEQEFLDQLAAHGIKISNFNLPDWKETAEGLGSILDSLFHHTPPTALVIEESSAFVAVQQHLAQRGIISPRDISLVCDDPDPVFSWCRPTIAHIHWDGTPIPERVVRWAANIARGRDDRRMTFIKATFVEGGTLGSVPK